MAVWKLDHTYTLGLDKRLISFARKALDVPEDRKTDNRSFGEAISGTEGGNQAQITTCMGFNGLIDSARSISFAGQQLALGFYSVQEYCVDFLCKVTVNENGKIKNYQRPFVVLCRLLIAMREMLKTGDISLESCYISKKECQQYLFPDSNNPLTVYETGDQTLARKIISGRPANENIELAWWSNDTWSAMLSFSGIFIESDSKFFLNADVDGVVELATMIAQGTFSTPDAERLYDHLAQKDSGILQIIPRMTDWENLLKKDISSAYNSIFDANSGIWKQFRFVPGLAISCIENEMLRSRLQQHLMLSRQESSIPVPQPSATNPTIFSYNKIYFGAPGTGKSFKLNEDSIALGFDDRHIERVTFYATYSYAQFVGTYKPSIDDENKELTYSFVPGPFIRQYVRAIQHPTERFLLIIEEINRANAAAVFGDTFQLLDRKVGKSVYGIAVSEDLKKYFKVANQKFQKDFPEEPFFPVNEDCIKLPDNLFIWATMNSADQGVFPLDTAFKRRWENEYMGIDSGEKEIEHIHFSLDSDGGGPLYSWNELRKKINSRLVNEFKVNEDKLIGPFYIDKDLYCEEEPFSFAEIIASKIIMYLFEDAAKPYRQNFFKIAGDAVLTYSNVCKEFFSRGASVFGVELSANENKKDSHPPKEMA